MASDESVLINNAVASDGPLEAINVQPVLNNARNVTEVYEENPEIMQREGLIATLPLLESLDGIIAIVALDGGLAIAGAQGGKKEDRDNSGKISLGLQISAAFVDCYSLYYIFVLAVTTDCENDFYAYSCALRYLGGLLFLFELLESLNGFGAPDIGSQFGDGAQEFSAEICDLLKDAMPSSDGWVGAAAAAYADKNKDQQARVKNYFANADSDVEKAISKQAELVELLRQVLAGAKAVLGSSTLIWARQRNRIQAGLSDPFGIESKILLEQVGYSVLAAILAVLVQVLVTVEKSFADIVPRIRKAKRLYEKVVDDVTVKRLASPQCITRYAACL